MQNFDYWTPTRLVFGRNAIEKLPEALAPYGRRVLLAYGGGSIRKIGLYDRVRELLAGCEVYELAGIAPNPKFAPSVLEGIRLCRAHAIDVILAVGGGSVLDCCKGIAGCARSEGDPWDIITGKQPTTGAVPIVDILTLAATGSEYDNAAVISRTETNDKVAYFSPLVFPAVSILDPTYTFSVSRRQTAAGTADAMNHVMEQYFVGDSTMLNDGFCEVALRSLMANCRKLLANPEDYTARAEMMLCCTYGCNGIYALGNAYGGWPCHGMEHALSAFYDITHGEGLAILTPRWMRHILSEATAPRLAQYGRHVFGVGEGLSDWEAAEKAIQATYDFFASIGIPMHLREVGIDESRIDEMAAHVVADWPDMQTAWVPLGERDIAEIFRASL
ncbi:MAG: iron-containing alcohol dehydrogenase [Kiritimatiellae bacterium]|nr:iron-containing alcohol dehydrogenase [Kiritimatiellia bacterium]